MKKWLVLGLLATSGLAQAQYGSQGTKVDAVLAMAQRYGGAELKGSADDWYIEGEMDDYIYQIMMMDCDRGTRYCESMYFVATWEGSSDSDLINAWNMDALSGRAYLDEEDTPTVEMWNSLKGVSREYLSTVFDQWNAVMSSFEADAVQFEEDAKETNKI